MLRVIPLTLKQANEAITKWHRHHKPVRGHRFSLGAELDGELVGVVVCGRPVARLTPAYSVCEVTRLATDGTRNACSLLYSAAARAAEAMGFDRIQTFILDSENGVSLRASGWAQDGTTVGRDWNVPSRGGRRTDQPMCDKSRWSRTFVQKRRGR